MNKYTLIFFLLFFPLETLAATSLPTPEHVAPKHVYALAQLVSQKVESLRYIMGAPKINNTLFQVINAEPREVYFQAVNLYEKTSRLHHNLTARSISDHDLPPVGQHIQPADVWAVLSVISTQLNEINHEYQIHVQASLPAIEENKEPSDVYQSLLLTIRQVNQMLREKPYTHSDVYQEITTAFYCLLKILTNFPNVQMQQEPTLQPGKKAEDVFTELISTYQTIRSLMQLSDFKILELSITSTPNLQSGDIYELAVLITSELKFLHSKTTPKKTALDAAYPGIKFPSHVLQRLTHLHNHLQAILQEVRKNPHLIGEQEL